MSTTATRNVRPNKESSPPNHRAGPSPNNTDHAESMKAIQEKYGINYRPPEWDKLLIACQKNNAHLVALFLTPVELGGEGISPNHANAVDQSALHIAGWWAHNDCIAILLKYGADVHARNKITAATPLHSVCQSNRAFGTWRRLQAVDLLLKAGANMEAVDENDNKPVDYIQDTDPDCREMRSMLTSTANLPANAFYYQMPEVEHYIIEAIKIKKPLEEVSHHLAELASVLQIRSDKNKGMKMLVDKQSPLKILLENWMEKEELDNFSYQALEAFVEFQYTIQDPGKSDPPRVCKLYLEPEGPVNMLVGKLCKAIMSRYKYNGKTFASDALLQEWTQAVTLLRPYVTDVTVPSKLWLEMSRRNYLDLAHLFWDRWKIDPTPVVGPQDMTPIHFAARSGNLQFLQCLVQIQTSKVQGEVANPLSITEILQLTNKLGQTPAKAAQVNKKEDIVQWLKSQEQAQASA